MALRAICILWFAALAQAASPAYLFAFFRDNGEKGVYFALSSDGYTYRPLHKDQPVLAPEHPGMLMRDPFLTQGPDKLWHLVWTTGWTRATPAGPLTIGHATSTDLVTWSPQQLVEVPLAGARNAWAPEIVWDPKAKEWILFWASTIPGRFPDTEATGDTGYNHRLYSMTTKDWKSFSAPRLYFDPGFNAIDSTVTRAGDRWVMVFKDERKEPLMKRLRLAFADEPTGPWRSVSDPFTIDWVEGPSVLKLGRQTLIYFDHYAKPQYYGAYLTENWKEFHEMTGKLQMPAHPRHGSFVAMTEAERRALARLED